MKCNCLISLVDELASWYLDYSFFLRIYKINPLSRQISHYISLKRIYILAFEKFTIVGLRNLFIMSGGPAPELFSKH